MMDVDDDDDYFFVLPSSHHLVMYTRLFEKKLRLLGPSRMDVYSPELSWVMRARMSFFIFFFL